MFSWRFGEECSRNMCKCVRQYKTSFRRHTPFKGVFSFCNLKQNRCKKLLNFLISTSTIWLNFASKHRCLVRGYMIIDNITVGSQIHARNVNST